MGKIEQAKWEMIDAGGRTAQSFGINRLLGQLYMYLFLSDEAQCLDDMASDLCVSKASISIACRQLEGWGALKKVWKKGDRKDYYEAITDFGRILNDGLMTSINKKLGSAKIQIQRCMDSLDQAETDKNNHAFLRERLKKAEKYRSRVEKTLNNPWVKKLI